MEPVAPAGFFDFARFLLAPFNYLQASDDTLAVTLDAGGLTPVVVASADFDGSVSASEPASAPRLEMNFLLPSTSGAINYGSPTLVDVPDGYTFDLIAGLNTVSLRVTSIDSAFQIMSAPDAAIWPRWIASSDRPIES